MARRVGGWSSLVALAAIGCRAGAPAETTRGAATASVQLGAETSVDQPGYQDRQGTQVSVLSPPSTPARPRPAATVEGVWEGTLKVGGAACT